MAARGMGSRVNGGARRLQPSTAREARGSSVAPERPSPGRKCAKAASAPLPTSGPSPSRYRPLKKSTRRPSRVGQSCQSSASPRQWSWKPFTSDL
eukprot:6708349-Pyramimonas_sp.AAC.1